MGRSYSLDLRQRVVSRVDGGRSRRGAAADLSGEPVVLGQAGRAPRAARAHWSRSGKAARPAPASSRPYRDFLIGRVKEKPDITMPELAAELAGTARRRG